MAYDPGTGLWKPDPVSANGTNTSSVSDNVNGLLAKGSPYIDQAKSAGVDYANARGVQNSSIAAGASEKAAYDAVVPIATADAAANTQKDLSFQNNASSERIAQLGANTQTNIASMNIADADKQQAASILSNERMSGNQLATQQAIAAMNISDADKQQLLSIASQERQAGMTQSTQLQVANMNVSANQQDKAQGAAVSYANIYGTMVNTINANKDIPADARTAYLANAKTLYDNGLKLVEQTYNVQLDWGQNTPDTSGGLNIPANGLQPGAGDFADNTVQ